MTGTLDIRRARDRFHTKIDWLDSYHSFSFSDHYDPANTHHGLLLVSNDDLIKAGTGFRTHPHQDMEIVTWVLNGEIEHKDSVGNTGIIYPGLAQRMSAGRGIWHSEMNPRGDQDVHLVQMWVAPDTERITREGGNVNIVDVRAAEDYAEGHIPCAVNLPKDRWSTLEGLRKDKINVVYCYSQVCHLAAAAAFEFASRGYPVMELEGGFRTWKEHEMDIEK